MATKENQKHGEELLVVAGMDRLDTPLTIAHMQGKFQYKNVPNSGHVIRENPLCFLTC